MILDWIWAHMAIIMPIYAIFLIAAIAFFTYTYYVQEPRLERARKARDREREQRAKTARLIAETEAAREREEEARRQYANAQATLDILNMMSASAQDARVALIREAYLAGKRGE